MALHPPGPRHKIILQPDLDPRRAKFNWPIKQDVEGAGMRFFAKILVQRLAAAQQSCGVPATRDHDAAALNEPLRRFHGNTHELLTRKA
jgi:hypothetical protein